MANKNIRVGTFFSGIGSPEKALQKLKEDGIVDDYEIVFFCVTKTPCCTGGSKEL